MHHRTVEELMTRDVVRARSDTSFKELARFLEENDITAVPVVDEMDRPIGVVSEADLLRKSADQADPSGLTPSRIWRHGSGPRPRAHAPRN